MKVKPFYLSLPVFLVTITQVFGQSFEWTRTIAPSKSAGWHMFSLPPEMAAKTQANYPDLRIMAVDKKGDTTEVPYFLSYPQHQQKKVGEALNILNKTTREGLFYYTLEQPGKVVSLNEIELNFEEKNFDIKVNLEGSLNQQEWFSILKDYRITGIHNSKADFHFTTLGMSFSNYKFYRLSFAAPKNPELLTAYADITMKQDDAAWWIYPNLKNKIETKNIEKETISVIDLPGPLPVSLIQIHITDTIQFIRPVTIKVVPFTGNGEARNEDPFVTVGTSTLNSFDKQIIETSNIITKKVKVIIHNANNTPLKVDSIILKASKQQVITRLPEAEKYMLLYGNKKVSAPYYDLEEVFAHIPLPELGNIQVGPETRNLPEKAKSWWESNNWLYALMGLIIVMLGGFTLKMMRKP